MREIRQLSIVIFFILLCAGVMIYSYQSSWSREDFNFVREDRGSEGQESYFKEINYFVSREKPFIQLEASELNINEGTKKTIFFNPRGVALSSDLKPVYYEGKRGLLDQETNILTLDEEVAVRASGSRSTSDKMKYFIDEGKINSIGNVLTKSVSASTGDQLIINSDRALSWLDKERSLYRGNVQGKVERKKAYEQNLDFRSQSLDLHKKTNYAELKGNVFIKKQLLTARSRRGEIFFENYNKKLKYFVLYDDVKVEEKVWMESSSGRESFIRKAFSEKLEGIMSEDKIVLTGYPKVYQQQDVIKGNRIILRENNEVVEVDDANTNFILKN